MSVRRQPSNKLERCPWSRIKLLVNELQGHNPFNSFSSEMFRL